MAEEYEHRSLEVEYRSREYELAMRYRMLYLVRSAVYEEMANRLTEILNRYTKE